jgi:hypothetical protein
VPLSETLCTSIISVFHFFASRLVYTQSSKFDSGLASFYMVRLVYTWACGTLSPIISLVIEGPNLIML